MIKQLHKTFCMLPIKKWSRVPIKQRQAPQAPHIHHRIEEDLCYESN